ncbi:MAG: hypothetical protein QW412_00855 [Candidatus Aenigmatarchaeota archaeon]
MSIKEIEGTISNFESYISLLSNNPEFLGYASESLSKLGVYLPQLKETKEYKDLEKLLNSFKTPLKGKFSLILHSKKLSTYGGKVAAEARKELEKIKEPKKPLKVKPKIKREIVTLKIPPSPWYKVINTVNKLSDAMWEDEEKIRKVLTIFEELYDKLRSLGDPENFSEELKNFYEILKKERGELTIPELIKLKTSYIQKDEELKTLITRLKGYANRKIEEII